jgi:hypothetical protein
MYKEIDYPALIDHKERIWVSLRTARGVCYLELNMGLKVVEAASFKEGEHIRVFIDDTNPRKWCFRKSDNGIGYKLWTGKLNKPDYLNLKLKWTLYVPEESEKKRRSVKYKITEEGLEVDGSL